jgi:hypothetical protein
LVIFGLPLALALTAITLPPFSVSLTPTETVIVQLAPLDPAQLTSVLADLPLRRHSPRLAAVIADGAGTTALGAGPDAGAGEALCGVGAAGQPVVAITSPAWLLARHSCVPATHVRSPFATLADGADQVVPPPAGSEDVSRSPPLSSSAHRLADGQARAPDVGLTPADGVDQLTPPSAVVRTSPALSIATQSSVSDAHASASVKCSAGKSEGVVVG